ncbi:unannotated protein [freshwater metagenome]|uniref:Unannotated protein n=1 Tax=freshwater metagenome TaxID=449393 RepID=A0A6J7E271_9ZZZZ|nr:SRPBCC family protein [Actinomycetota bacterium]
MTEISVSRIVKASPDRVWSLITDITRMGDWSPETTSCSWVKGATGPAVGARFKGNNQNANKKWSTICTVTTLDQPKVFAFEVDVALIKIARWTYTIEPGLDDPNSCVVTETWTDRRGRLVTKLGKPLSGVDDRLEHNRAGMVTTLENLAAGAEQG